MSRIICRFFPAIFLTCVFSFATAQEGAKYSIKTGENPIPKEVSDPVKKLLAASSAQLLDPDGKALCDVWFRKDIPAEATVEQIKSGVTFREVKQTEILGVIQFHHDGADYRKQKIKAGVYTLRLAYQPTDGKHTAFAEYQECALLIAAKDDKQTALMEAKTLHERSRESVELPHPAVFMLWPNTKPGKEPDLAARPKNHWVVNSKLGLIVDGKATGASIGIGLTLVGHSPAE